MTSKIVLFYAVILLAIRETADWFVKNYEIARK